MIEIKENIIRAVLDLREENNQWNVEQVLEAAEAYTKASGK